MSLLYQESNTLQLSRVLSVGGKAIPPKNWFLQINSEFRTTCCLSVPSLSTVYFIQDKAAWACGKGVSRSCFSLQGSLSAGLPVREERPWIYHISEVRYHAQIPDARSLEMTCYIDLLNFDSNFLNVHTINLDIAHKVLPKTGNGSTLVRLWHHTLTPSAACSGDANLEDNRTARFQGSHTSVFLSSLAPDDLRCILPLIATAVYRRASCWTCHLRLASRVCISSELPRPHSAEGNQQPAAAAYYIRNTYALIVPNLKKV